MIFENDYSRTRHEGYILGQRDMLDRMEAMFTQWATTHPEGTVRDELWGFVEKIRKEIGNYE